MLSTIVGLVLDVGVGAVAFRLVVDLRRLVNIHEGRISALEKYTGLTLA